MGLFFYSSVLLLLFLAATYLSYRATRYVIVMLKKQQVIDIPNDRSNHSLPIPRGGGLAVAGIILAGFLIVTYWIGKMGGAWPLIVATWVLGMVSFSDDVKGLSVRVRFGVQFAAVGVGLLLLPVKAWLGVESVVLLSAAYCLIALGWVWFINLYNFMDGIDGITAIETISVMLGAAIIFVHQDLPAGYMAAYAVIIAGSAAGFLFFNWHPASVFMGDVGSVVLGFIVGWVLLHLALQGYLVSAIILPAYYLLDSGVTLIKRLIAGENIFEAHSKHYYQQAIRNGMKHSQVSFSILKLNIVLVLLAYLSAFYPLSGFVCLPLALLSVWWLMCRFSGGRFLFFTNGKV